MDALDLGKVEWTRVIGAAKEKTCSRLKTNCLDGRLEPFTARRRSPHEDF
jgi:hypothetical protein